jgi:beta-glucanase (GH16 family)
MDVTPLQRTGLRYRNKISAGLHAARWPAIFCALAFFYAPAASTDTGGPPLDLSHMHMTFNETFKTLSISPWGPDSVWIAHTPWNGDFGAAQFDLAGPYSPFTLTKNGLDITARQDPAVHWHSGLLASEDREGRSQNGFAQRYGYFEICAKLPGQAGDWPAFWLSGLNSPAGKAEFDVFEFYGHDNTSFRTSWGMHGSAPAHNFGASHRIFVAPGSLSTQFNVFGVLITPTRMITYLNGREVLEAATPADFKVPFFMIANLAIGGGWPYDQLHGPQTMSIRYIRAYQFN